jgi:hypothetical protein
MCGPGPKLPKLLVVAAFAIAALGATPLAATATPPGPNAPVAAADFPPGLPSVANIIAV